MSLPIDSQGRLRWPQASASENSLAGAELADLRAEQEKLQAELASVKAEQSRLANAARNEAEAADRDAYAQAIRSGSPDPGPEHVEKLQADVLATDRRRAALETAIGGVTRDAQKLIARRHDAYVEDAAKLEAEAHAALTLLVAELGEGVRDFTDRASLALWLQGDRARVPRVQGLAKESGDAYTVTDLLERLASAVKQWKR